jgi:hypothetical protein
MAREVVTSENKAEHDKKHMEKKAGKKSNLIPIYHGTSEKDAKHIDKHGFDVDKSADSSIWFTTNPKIGDVAATGKGGVIKRHIDESKLKLGSWDESDKYFTDELIKEGYHGLKFPKANEAGDTHYRIWNPEMLHKE